MPEHVTDDAIRFPDGIPGFPDAHHFALEQLTEDGTFQILQSLDDPACSMVVGSPWVFFPDYELELEEVDRIELALREPGDAVVFCTVSSPEDDDNLYVNLLGPLVVNRHTRTGRQVVLADAGLPVRAAVPIQG